MAQVLIAVLVYLVIGLVVSFALMVIMVRVFGEKKPDKDDEVLYTLAILFWPLALVIEAALLFKAALTSYSLRGLVHRLHASLQPKEKE